MITVEDRTYVKVIPARDKTAGVDLVTPPGGYRLPRGGNFLNRFIQHGGSEREVRRMETIAYPRYTIPEKIILTAVKIIAWPFERLLKKCLALISKIDEDCFV
jgi:hypothetical protein